MCKINFSYLWHKWMLECVGSATTSILVNDSPTDEFSMERGLRQGGPLSSFLFLLVVEGMNILMKPIVHWRIFIGYKVGREESILIFHLQFADETLILRENNWANVWAMRATLILFEAISCLNINFNKGMLTDVNMCDSWLLEATTVLKL